MERFKKIGKKLFKDRVITNFHVSYFAFSINLLKVHCIYFFFLNLFICQALALTQKSFVVRLLCNTRTISYHLTVHVLLNGGLDVPMMFALIKN
jgi:hypothetical protein